MRTNTPLARNTSAGYIIIWFAFLYVSIGMQRVGPVHNPAGGHTITRFFKERGGGLVVVLLKQYVFNILVFYLFLFLFLAGISVAFYFHFCHSCYHSKKNITHTFMKTKIIKLYDINLCNSNAFSAKHF